MHTFICQKTLLHTLFCLFLKLLEALSVSLTVIAILSIVDVCTGPGYAFAFICFIIFIWLNHDQLWAIIAGEASLTKG